MLWGFVTFVEWVVRRQRGICVMEVFRCFSKEQGNWCSIKTMPLEGAMSGGGQITWEEEVCRKVVSVKYGALSATVQ